MGDPRVSPHTPANLDGSPQERTRLIIASDIALFCEGLAVSLGAYNELEIVGAASSREAVLDLIASRAPYAVVIDTAMSGALDLVRTCARWSPETRFVAVAVTDTENDVIACAEAGVTGYVTRDGSVDELVTTIARARRGELLCSPRVAGSLFRRLAAIAARSAPDTEISALTHREIEIVTLLGHGFSNKEIARRLSIEVATVKNHVHNILEKLHVTRRADAAARMRASGGPLLDRARNTPA